MATRMTLSRRRFLAAGLCGCLFCQAGAVMAAPRDGRRSKDGDFALESLQPLVGPGYRPVDADERGLWQMWERLEEEMAASSLLMKAPDLHRYTVGVVERLMGEQARDVRVYLLHDATFNAAMTPNGMMMVNSGLLARVRSEAQLAAVLGHEAGHYVRRHSVSRWRDFKTKTGIMAFVTAGTAVAAGVTARQGGDPYSWIELADSINTSLALSDRKSVV